MTKMTTLLCQNYSNGKGCPFYWGLPGSLGAKYCKYDRIMVGEPYDTQDPRVKRGNSCSFDLTKEKLQGILVKLHKSTNET